MPYDQRLADRVRPLLSRKHGFAEKKMFGGIGFLLEGNMCVAVWKHFVILRLGPEQATAALEQPGVQEFDITGRPMKGWVMIDGAAIHGDSDVSDWVAQAVEFVRALPPK